MAATKAIDVQYQAYRRLAICMFEQAVNDLGSRDLFIRARARLWLWNDGPAWLDLLSLDCDLEGFSNNVIFGGLADGENHQH